MAKYFFSEHALTDLKDILDYTAEEWSESHAEKYYTMILSTCRKICLRPALAKKYFDVYLGLFGQHTGKHIIFYRIINEDRIEIARILHESMDIESKAFD